MINKRWSKVISVLVQLTLLAAVGLWLGRLVWRQYAALGISREHWAQRDGFVAISYGGLSREEGGANMPRALFARHLEALAAEGFEVIGLDDVINFLVRGDPLPEKAVYLMFEGGRKDSAIFGQEQLLLYGGQATMFVQTSFNSRWNRTYLNESHIRAIARSSLWNIGTSGDELFLPPTASGPGGKQKYFLTDYMRDGEGKPTETPAEFRERAERDYRRASEIMDGLTGRHPRAFIFMPANTFNNSLPQEITEINRDLMAKHFQVAFTREGESYNGRYVSPYELTRMRVPSDCTPEQLIAEIKARLPRDVPYRSDDADGLARWKLDAGKLALHEEGSTPGSGGNGLTLTAELGQNAFAWLRGSNNWRNTAVSCTLSKTTGIDQNIYLRYISRDSYLRVLTNDDVLRVQERVPGRGIVTLLERRLPDNDASRLELVLKNDRLTMTLNGENPLDSSLPISDAVIAGMTALEVVARGDRFGFGETGSGVGDFINLEVMPLVERWRLVDSSALRRTAVERDEGGEFTALAIPVGGREYDQAVLAGLLLDARDKGLAPHALLPAGSVDFGVLDSLNRLLPAALRSTLWEGVIFSPTPKTMWADLEKAVHEARLAGLQPSLLVNPSLADALAARKESLRVDWVLVDGPGLKAGTYTALKRRYSNILTGNDFGRSFTKEVNHE